MLLTSWHICLDLVTAPGMNAFKKEQTTWSKPIDILAISAQFATESFTSASNGITLRDTKISQDFVKNLEANSRNHKGMRKENNHTKIGTRKDLMTFKSLKINKVQANALDHALTITDILTKKSRNQVTLAR